MYNCTCPDTMQLLQLLQLFLNADFDFRVPNIFNVCLRLIEILARIRCFLWCWIQGRGYIDSGFGYERANYHNDLERNLKKLKCWFGIFSKFSIFYHFIILGFFVWFLNIFPKSIIVIFPQCRQKNLIQKIEYIIM